MQLRRRRIPVVCSAMLLLSAGMAGASRAHELVDVAPPVAVVEAPLPNGAVARVGTSLVSRRAYRHWFRVAAGRRPPRTGSRRHIRVRREAMEFLIQGAWVRLEARDHGLRVSRRQVRRAFRKQRRAAFDDLSDYRRFLRASPMTEADVLERVKLDLLQTRLTSHAVSGSGTSAAEQEALDRFVAAFRAKWRARTACAIGYRMRDCGREVPPASG